MAAPELLTELKGVSFFSTSPTSTTTTTTMDDHHYSMLTAIGNSGRAIDRFSPHLRDTLRVKSFNPEQLTQQQEQQPPPSKPKPYSPSPRSKANGKLPTTAQLISPASSSRYLLSESSSEDLFDTQPARSETDIVSKARRFQSAKVQESTVVWPEIEMELPSSVQSVKVEQFFDEHTWPSSSSSSSTTTTTSTMPQNQQEVVLKVSLHCKGCEGKVRKHISKMEGVTSFTTDLTNKKVTVVGDVTPLGVLNSISKVKNAQLWRSLPPTSA